MEADRVGRGCSGTEVLSVAADNRHREAWHAFGSVPTP
jgi:hypothetical protein